MTAAPWAFTTDDHWTAIVAVCGYRDQQWALEIQKAGKGDKGHVRQCGVISVLAIGLHFQAALGVICSG